MKELLRLYFSIILILFAINSGCSTLPASVKKIPDESKIPLKVAVVFTNRFKKFYPNITHYYYLRSGEEGSRTTVGFNIGEASVSIFKKGIPYVFKEVHFVPENSNLKEYQLILVPYISKAEVKEFLPKKKDIFSAVRANPLISPGVLNETDSELKNRFSYSRAYIKYNINFKDPNGRTIFMAMGEGSGISNPLASKIAVITDTGSFNQSMSRAQKIAFEQLIQKILSSPELAAYARAEVEKRTLPANLIATIQYTDNDSLIPNNTIDAGEESFIIADITNKGDGTAFDVKLNTQSSYSEIDFPEIIPVGDIQPGESKTVELSLKASLNISEGEALFSIQTKERRGYDAQSVQIKIPVKRLEEPKLAITKIELNDANLGQAKGNGDGNPENGETIELIALIQNTGVGTAFGTTFKLVESSSGVNVLSDQVDIGRIEPNAIEKAKAVIEIPRTYSNDKLEYKLVATEVRNACPPVEKYGYYVINQLAPVLAYEFIPPVGLKNASSDTITITPKNEGTLPANGVQLSVTTNVEGVKLENNSMIIGTLAPQTSAKPQTILIQIPRTYTQADLPVQINITQDEFADLTEIKTIPLQIVKPQLQLIDQSKLHEQVTQGATDAQLVLKVRNDGDLAAEDVKISILSSVNLITFRRDETVASEDIDPNEVTIGELPPFGLSDPKKFTIDVPGAVQPGAFPIQVTITQRDFPSVTETLNYEIVARGPIPVPVPIPTLVPIPTPPKDINQPPEILVSEITDGQTIYSNRLSLIASVSDDKGLASVKGSLNNVIFYNSQMDAGATVGDTSLIIRKELTGFHPKPDENIIEIVAVDTDNQFQTRKLTIYYNPSVDNIVDLPNPSDVDINLPQGQPNLDAAALIIGIATYQNIPAALYADRDAIAFQQYCGNTLGINDDHIELLLNDKATLAGIKKSIRQLYNLGSQIKEVFIFYSGHGYPKSIDGKRYLVPYDGDPVFLDDTCLSIEEFYKQLDGLPAKDIIIFMDACFSGEDRRANQIIPDAKPVKIKYQRKEDEFFATGKSTQIVSSEGEKISWCYDEKRHGLFTYYLLKGLQGEADDGSGKLIIGKLYEYLLQQIPAAAHRLKEVIQTPEIQGVDRDKVIVRY